MNAINPGAIIEVATPRGLSPVIVSNVSGGKVTGFLVRAHDHLDIIGPIETDTDMVVAVIDGERAAITGMENGEDTGVVIYKDDDGLLVRPIGQGGERYVKDVPSAVDATVDYLQRLDRQDAADRIRAIRDISISILTETLEA